MPRVSLIQTNFTAGEIAPRLMGRVDIARYQNGAKTILNAHPLTHGGCMRRSGALFVAMAKSTARLIPYIFNRDQSYVLEFGDQYIRVFKDGGQVETSPGVPYEIATPYTEAMLSNLGYVQGADTMFIAHPSVPIYRLRRFGHASWDLSAAPFSVVPFDEIGATPAITLTLSSAAVGTGRTFTAGAAVFLAADVGRQIVSSAGAATITSVTSATVATGTITIAFPGTSVASGAWTITVSPQTTCAPSAKDPVGAAITLTLGANGWSGGDVGKFVKINGGLAKITGVTSATIANASIVQEMTAIIAAPALAWSLESAVWNDTNGYPRAITLNEQRLIAAGSDAFPQTIWGSKTGVYLDFTQGTADDDGFTFNIASNQLNPITHLGQIKQMLVLTYGGEFSVEGGVEKPVTPTNVQVKSQSAYGCNATRPARIGNELLFVQRSGYKVRAMAYQYQNEAFGSPDLTVLAQHITESGIVDMAYQQESDSMLWCVRADGALVSLTIEREQDVVGWARHTTAGTFESVATIPVAGGEQTWFIVKRTLNGAIKRCIEVMDAAVNTDCAVRGSHPTGAKEWSGLGHLEGQTVDIVADGAVMQPQVVTGGCITLPRNALAVEIGLHYESMIELLNIEVNTGTGTAQGNAVRTGEATVRLLGTSGCDIQGQTIPFRRFGSGVLDQSVQPFTGDKRVELLGWERSGGSITIRQTQPLPMHIVAVIRKVTVND